jgi:hypothetical protein
MNAMGHAVPTMLGVDHRGLIGKIQQVVPDYMLMGERGMSDMGGEMEMPIPDNTAPMMTGRGQYGALEMGGMFTVFKVRKEQKPGDYSDPGPYRHPRGSVAYAWEGSLPQETRMPTGTSNLVPDARAVKPRGGHSEH